LKPFVGTHAVYEVHFPVRLLTVPEAVCVVVGVTRLASRAHRFVSPLQHSADPLILKNRNASNLSAYGFCKDPWVGNDPGPTLP